MALPLAVEAALAPNEVRRAPIGPGLLDANCRRARCPGQLVQEGRDVHGGQSQRLCAPVAVLRCCTGRARCVRTSWSASGPHPSNPEPRVATSKVSDPPCVAMSVRVCS